MTRGWIVSILSIVVFFAFPVDGATHIVDGAGGVAVHGSEPLFDMRDCAQASNHDIEGVPRPMGDDSDLGAYEFIPEAAGLVGGDINDDGDVDIADATFLLAWLFGAEPKVPPPAPYPDCGSDPTGDELACDGHAACP